MVRYGIDDLNEGMIIGQSIYGPNKRLLIAAGFKLKPVHIDLLKKWGYTSVNIEVEGTEGVTPESIISELVQEELAVSIDKTSKGVEGVLLKHHETKNRVVDIIKKEKKMINQIIRGSGAYTIVNKVIDDIMSDPWAVFNLTKMQHSSNELFEHTVNVTVISLCIGHKYRFTDEEMKQLGLGAINYDMGMLAVPKEVLQKESTLTEDEEKILQQHAVYGYLMLSGVSEIPSTGSIVALSHHVYQDGSGYPRGIKGENRPPIKNLEKGGLIHRFAEIIAVADVYNMYIEGRRHYSQPLEPKEVIKKMIEMRGTKLNADIVKTLISIVPMYPIGTRVKIADGPVSNLVGCIGVVSKIEPERLSEPQVIIFESKNHQRIKPVVLNLAKHKGFTIELLN